MFIVVVVVVVVFLVVVVFAENSRNEYRKRIDSLRKAWSLVGQDLKTHGI